MITIGELREEQDKLLASRLLDRGRQALKRHAPLLTPFLDPRQQRVAEAALRTLEELTHYTYGGYPGAERVRLALMPRYMQNEEPDMELSFLRVRGDFREEDLSHRDVLGAVLALGLKREVLGDIVVDQEGAVIIAAEEAAKYIRTGLKRVGPREVAVEDIKPGDFIPPPARTKSIRGTVASLRLDAVASLGYSVSRTKIVSVIKAEQVKVNWQPVKNPSAAVKEGDIISISGRGRLEVAKVGQVSRKGRLHVEVKKYL